MSAMKRALLPIAVALLGSARAGEAGGARAGVEVGLLSGVQNVILEVHQRRARHALVGEGHGWLLDTSMEWSLGRTVHIGGAIWLSLLDVSTTDRAVRERRVFSALTPRLRLSLPIAHGLASDVCLDAGLSHISGTAGGALGGAIRLGTGLSYPVSDDLGVFAAVSWIGSIGRPAQAWVEDVSVREPYMLGFGGMLFSVGVRALR